MHKIVIATRNIGKFVEIRHIFTNHVHNLSSCVDSIHLSFTNEFRDLPYVIENGSTLYENALKKAREVSNFTSLPSLSDDTGLFVRALDGEPGIHAATYAGEQSTYEENVDKLLENMKDKEDTYAYFKTVCLLFIPNGYFSMKQEEKIIYAEGLLEGNIIPIKKGRNGFGYDPIFVPLNYNITLAEMDEDEKNKISHRFKAIINLLNSINIKSLI